MSWFSCGPVPATVRSAYCTLFPCAPTGTEKPTIPAITNIPNITSAQIFLIFFIFFYLLFFFFNFFLNNIFLNTDLVKFAPNLPLFVDTIHQKIE